jgi:hypothetical protein
VLPASGFIVYLRPEARGTVTSMPDPLHGPQSRPPKGVVVRLSARMPVACRDGLEDAVPCQRIKTDHPWTPTHLYGGT